MPQFFFRNFTAATRKPNAIQFGLYRKEATADVSWIEGLTAGGGRLTITGTQDGVNTTFTLSGTPVNGADGLIFARNGSALSPTTDFTVSGNTVTTVVAPLATDILLAIAIGGQ